MATRWRSGARALRPVAAFLGAAIALARPALSQDTSLTCAPSLRCSTPGVTFELRESSRQKTVRGMVQDGPDYMIAGISAGQSKDGTVITYRAVTSGFPRGRTFVLWFESAGPKPVAVSAGWVADSTGALVCGDSARIGTVAPSGAAWCNKQFAVGSSLANVSLGAFKHTLGEVFRLGITASDETVRAHAGVFPFPLESVNAGCHVSLELLEVPAGDVFIARGKGFDTGDTVRWVSRSDKQSLRDSLPVLADGTLKPFFYVPGVKGKRGGEATITFEARKCRNDIVVPWGSALKPK